MNGSILPCRKVVLLQATIGKRAVKVTVDITGNKISFGQAAVENILRVIPFIGFFCVIVIVFLGKEARFA